MTSTIPPVGARVRDRAAGEHDESTLLVVALTSYQASDYTIDSDGTTVADVNPGYPDDDPVVECVFLPLESKTPDIASARRYAFPARRLEPIPLELVAEDDLVDAEP